MDHSVCRTERESARYYIPAPAAEIDAMLKECGAAALSDLYSHIPASVRFQGPLPLPAELSQDEIAAKLTAMAAKNAKALSFLGDGLPDYSVHEIAAYVCGIRGLLTAYTPYQPERGQGTLFSLWTYECLMASLCGFDAVNASLYDRATALFEAMTAAHRLSKPGADVVIVPEAVYPGDMEVVETLARGTKLQIARLPLDPATGRTSPAALKALAESLGPKLAGIVIAQVNCLGLLEDVDALADVAADAKVSCIAVADPILLAKGGLKVPSKWGTKGADMMVGEAQHLAMSPCYGGPGLGVFAVRFSDGDRTTIRQSPGRFIGKALDAKGRDCRVMVLSTREQHIRREKATSNICSNEAFVATLAAASMLARGGDGLASMIAKARAGAIAAYGKLAAIEGVRPAFPQAPFFNEIVLETNRPAAALVEHCRKAGIHAGVDVSGRVAGKRQLILISFSDRQGAADVAKLADAFRAFFGGKLGPEAAAPGIPVSLRRDVSPSIPKIPLPELKAWYEKLGALNLSPDAAPYPLGSCTMKYNPLLNEKMAGLPGFNDLHPEAPEADSQGALELLYETELWFKAITGLAGVCTQPVAGAHGELLGLKLIQAYHADKGEAATRTVMLLPHTAHGTNFASAAAAGYAEIVQLDADESGRIDSAKLDAVLAARGPSVAGIMVTNPNTSGIFETNFRELADKIHAVGGLVYMDGANMNAIAGHVNLGALGVDAVHNNLHKTWSIPHGGGGPGDAIVAVSEKLVPFMCGVQVKKNADGSFSTFRAPKSIGSFHRHGGNFQNKIRAYAYLLRLGAEGVPTMSATAVLASRHLFERLKHEFRPLPANSSEPRMHEFILSLKEEDFALLEAAGVQRGPAITGIGKLFLDFGYHAPTMSFPEVHGMMIEPTESFTLAELDRLADTALAILRLVRGNPKIVLGAPYTMPAARIDEVGANRKPVLSEKLAALPAIPESQGGKDPIMLPVSQIEGLLRAMA
ncbi:MAG TPA: aminomethyl-transferring glycine dehydrogenase subunit GcvPB [Opitutales bacterium]|nr:aminomethyl-transferring glycine dehydrogenase subunit GcvPB [Opitutales bacterium]